MEASASRRCHARTRSGERCRRPATPGAAVCVMHGSATPRVAARTRERLLRALAAYYLAAMGEGPAPDPETARLARAVLRLRQRGSRTPRWWARLEREAFGPTPPPGAGEG